MHTRHRKRPQSKTFTERRWGRRGVKEEGSKGGSGGWQAKKAKTHEFNILQACKRSKKF